MITLCRDRERHHIQRGQQEVWNTFYPQEGSDQSAVEFGLLATLDEIRLPPGGVSFYQPSPEAEILTYVYEGGLAQEDSSGGSGVLHAGEFQRMTVGRGVRHKETNASSNNGVRIFRIGLHPSQVGLGSAREQKRFAVAHRRNLLCAVASPDGRQGSLRILQDTLIYSSVLDPGHHLIHELLPARYAWIHVIYGEVIFQDFILAQGDGVGVKAEPTVSLTVQTDSEILLVDMGPTVKSLAGMSGSQ